MADHSVTQISSLINQQIEIQEQMEISLWKLEALIEAAVLSENFYDLSRSSLHHYFLIVSGLIEELSNTNQISIDTLCKLRAGMLPSNVC